MEKVFNSECEEVDFYPGNITGTTLNKSFHLLELQSSLQSDCVT